MYVKSISKKRNPLFYNISLIRSNTINAVCSYFSLPNDSL